MKKRDATRREKLAGYFFDLSKLIFAGMVIGLILPLLSDTENAKMWIIAVFGIILTTLSALLANKILKQWIHLKIYITETYSLTKNAQSLMMK